LMVGLDKMIKVQEIKHVVEEIKNEPETTSEVEPELIIEKKLKPKKKSFFEKFTEGLKDFLDNAE
jgi:cell division protein FtsA